MIEIRARIAGPFSALNGMPATVADPERRRDQRAQRAHGRRLARAVRAEEAEHLAVANLERDIVKSDAIAEALAQTLNRKRMIALRRGERASHRTGSLLRCTCPSLPRTHFANANSRLAARRENLLRVLIFVHAVRKMWTTTVRL